MNEFVVPFFEKNRRFQSMRVRISQPSFVICFDTDRGGALKLNYSLDLKKNKKFGIFFVEKLMIERVLRGRNVSYLSKNSII